MRSQSCTQTVLSSGDLHRLILHVVVRLSPHFFSFCIVYYLGIEVALPSVEIIAVAVAVLRSRFLVALSGCVHNKVVLVLLRDRRLPLVDH